MDRHNVSFNISHKASSRFQANARLSYDESKTYGMGTSEGNNRFNKMEHILQYRPVNSLTGNDRDLITGDDDLIDDESNPMQSPILSAQEETKSAKCVACRLTAASPSTSPNGSASATVPVCAIRLHAKTSSMAKIRCRQTFQHQRQHSLQRKWQFPDLQCIHLRL